MDDWNAWAVPWKLVVIDAGSVSRAALFTASTAVPRETSGRVLNDRVTAGNWPRWFTDNGPMLWESFDTALIGTSWFGRRTDIQHGERVRVPLVFRLQFHDDPILVGRGVNGRYLLLLYAAWSATSSWVAVMPSAEALSRSISTFTWGFLI